MKNSFICYVFHGHMNVN